MEAYLQQYVGEFYSIADTKEIVYIRCEMTPTSVGGEQQISISGGSQSPIWYSLRQDCRDAQKKYVMLCMTRISQQECRGILEFGIINVKLE